MRRQEKTNKAVLVVRPWHIFVGGIHQAGHETSYKFLRVQIDFFLAPFFLSKKTDDIMATISLELLENVGFVNKSQLWLVEPKIPGTRNTEAYQLHGHTPIVGTAHDRSSTRSIQEKEH